MVFQATPRQKPRCPAPRQTSKAARKASQQFQRWKKRTIKDTRLRVRLEASKARIWKWWLFMKERRRRRIKYDPDTAALMIQRWIRCRNRFSLDIHTIQREDAVKKIQRCWRNYWGCKLFMLQLLRNEAVRTLQKWLRGIMWKRRCRRYLREINYRVLDRKCLFTEGNQLKHQLGCLRQAKKTWETAFIVTEQRLATKQDREVCLRHFEYQRNAIQKRLQWMKDESLKLKEEIEVMRVVLFLNPPSFL